MPEASSSVSPDISSVRRRRRRGLSVPASACPQICHHPLTPSLEALDLSTLSPTQALASLRFLVLSYLADLETCLAKLESVDLGITATLKASGELTIDEARQWARIGLEMLEVIRAGVRSHIPEFHFAEMSVETFKSHLPDVPGLTEMRTHLPDVHLPSLHDFPTIARHAKMSTIKDVRSHLPDFDFTDMRSKLDDVRSRIHDIDFHQPLSYVPVLLDRLHSLHSHLSSMQIPSGLSMTSAEPSTLLLNLLDELLTSNILSELLPSPEAVAEGEEMLGNAAKQIASALRASLGGSQLISYVDLPEQWRDNPFVAHGYRFIPPERWPLIFWSLFSLHNQTLNIHTHLVPLTIWSLNAIPLFNPSFLVDIPETAFTIFALLCLLSSTIWHTMSGCAHSKTNEFCARVDYVGIGWLISASIGTVVHYGFQCHPLAGRAFLGVCFMTGVAGTVCPFMRWFNDYEYRKWRIFFFLCLSFSGLGPLGYMSVLSGPSPAFSFIRPLIPSFMSYIVGLVFYATHLPERLLAPRWRQHLDFFGAGSHAIWHVFIVLAISQHKSGIESMRTGMAGGCH